MPYRTPQERQSEDTDTLRGPGHGLDEGEWITYWRNLPHSIKGRMTSEATVASMMPTGQMVATFDAGVAALTRIRLGIVDWALKGPDGAIVPWDASRAGELIEGLPEETFTALQQRIGNGDRPDLDAPADPEVVRSETVGND